MKTTVLLAFLPLILAASGAPIISEFQASNNDTIRDEDDSTQDWIEVYNPDAVAVNLAGMSLTDDPALLQKWVFPTVTLAPRARLLVWASVKNRVNPAAPLHTNFDLAAAGEYLALVAADGTTKLSEFNPYPAQPGDRSYGSTAEIQVTETAVASGAACRWLVPVSTTPATWTTPSFIDTAWNAGATGIGYDRSRAPSVDYVPLLGAGGNVETAMYNVRSSCYVRIPFTFSGTAASVSSLILRMRYDDGYAAFLNGTRLNPPSPAFVNAPAVLAFDSAATTARTDTLATIFESIDLTSQKSLLVNGTNVLAVQALNQSAASSDLIMVPELEITRVTGSAGTQSGYFARPTPGTANLTNPVAGFVDEVTFSVKRGIYTTPQTVTLACVTPGAVIRYTTSGSPPTATTGTVYGPGAISVNASTVIRAAAFVPGWEPSPVKTHTYVFAASAVSQPGAVPGFPTTWGTDDRTGLQVPSDYAMDPGITGNPVYSPLMAQAITSTLPVVCLTADTGELFGYPDGIYSNGRLGDTVELPASMEYFEPGGTANWQENSGLRLHGGDAPYEHPKKPFRVYFRKDYGEGRLRHALFPGSPVDSFDKLQLRPGGHDGWAVPFGSGPESLARHATYCRDRFLRQTELDMGRLSHYGKYVHLFINGLYWGFYDLHEVQSKEYWADHKGGLETDWDVVEHSNANNPLFDVVDGQSAAMDALLALVRPASNAADPATLTALQTYLDLDEFIDNNIVQMWGGQNDWMGPVFRGVPGVNLTDATRFTNKNWQAARLSRGTEPGRFFWQTWDAEISMGNSLTSLVATQRVADFNHTLIGTPTTDIPHAAGVPGSPGPAAEIWYALRKHSAPFRMRVADRLQRHFFNAGAMTTARNQARLQAFRDQLELPIVAESARWGDVNTGDPDVVTFTRNDHWASEMNWMRDTFVAGRNSTLLSQMGAIGMWPATQAPVFAQFGGSVPSGYQLAMTDPNAAGGTVYYTLDGTDPMGPAQGGSALTLLGPSVSTTCFYKVPAFAYSPATSWAGTTAPPDIATWQQGPAALGFDASGVFAPQISRTVTGMQGVRASVFVRIPFTVTAEQKASLTTLTLRLKYDDGAYVFLNSTTPVLRLNANATGTPQHTHVATAERPDAEAVVYRDFDLTGQLSSLVAGTNVLSIQGLNLTAADDDFLCVPELVGTGQTGAPSATALAYSGPVTLPQSSTVKARVLRNGTWSALTEAPFIVGQPASASNLVISEFSYNPVPAPAEVTAGTTAAMLEFIELSNISASPVELNGCRFDDGILFDFSLHSSVLTIPPWGRIVLASNASAFAARYPGVPVAGIFQGGSNLSNSGERLELLSLSGSPVFDFVYDDSSPWPVAPDGGGFSLVLMNPQNNPDPAVPGHWRASIAEGGTPGSSDDDTFAAWASRLSGPMSPTADPDGNGLSSLVEYGLGLVPAADETDGILSAKFETIEVNGIPDTWLVVRCTRAAGADDVVVTPEYSTDLVTWTPLTDAVPPEPILPGGIQSLVRRSPVPVAASPRIWVRVTVSFR